MSRGVSTADSLTTDPGREKACPNTRRERERESERARERERARQTETKNNLVNCMTVSKFLKESTYFLCHSL